MSICTIPGTTTSGINVFFNSTNSLCCPTGFGAASQFTGVAQCSAYSTYNRAIKGWVFFGDDVFLPLLVFAMYRWCWPVPATKQDAQDKESAKYYMVTTFMIILILCLDSSLVMFVSRAQAVTHATFWSAAITCVMFTFALDAYRSKGTSAAVGAKPDSKTPKAVASMCDDFTKYTVNSVMLLVGITFFVLSMTIELLPGIAYGSFGNILAVFLYLFVSEVIALSRKELKDLNSLWGWVRIANMLSVVAGIFLVSFDSDYFISEIWYSVVMLMYVTRFAYLSATIAKPP